MADDRSTAGGEVRIERASPGLLHEVGGLRWDDAAQAGILAGPDGTTREQFADRFRDWALEHGDSHTGLVGLDQLTGAVVAFGFLAVTARVPTADRPPGRASADVQSVWVAPARRSAGIGHRLVTALLELARERGVEHVTVHSSDRAVTLYERVGFAHDPQLLDRVFTAPPPAVTTPEDT